MADDVLIERRSDGVAKITLNRPEVFNAFNAALHAASIETPRPTAPKPHELSAVLGEWWASMIEGAGLSEEAATLYQVRKADEVPKASSRDVAILYKHSRQSAASPDPELPEPPGQNRARNALAGPTVS